MSDWDAAQYLRFATERTRPAADLLARVPLDAAEDIVDLGCGPGNGTALLVARFPKARITGIDSAPDMLAQARRALSRVSFVQADLRDYAPHDAPDLIFANAVLQWLPDHEHLIPRLARLLKPGGCLAFQVPDNLEEPSHVLMRTVAADGPWSALIGEASTVRSRIPPAGAYYDWLRAADCNVDIWATTYVHPLPDAGAIVTWLQATGLRPFLAPLDHDCASPSSRPTRQPWRRPIRSRPTAASCCGSHGCSSWRGAPEAQASCGSSGAGSADTSADCCFSRFRYCMAPMGRASR